MEPVFPFHLIIFDYNRSSIENSWTIIFDDRLWKSNNRTTLVWRCACGLDILKLSYWQSTVRRRFTGLFSSDYHEFFTRNVVVFSIAFEGYGIAKFHWFDCRNVGGIFDETRNLISRLICYEWSFNRNTVISLYHKIHRIRTFALSYHWSELKGACL